MSSINEFQKLGEDLIEQGQRLKELGAAFKNPNTSIDKLHRLAERCGLELSLGLESPTEEGRAESAEATVDDQSETFNAENLETDIENQERHHLFTEEPKAMWVDRHHTFGVQEPHCPTLATARANTKQGETLYLYSRKEIQSLLVYSHRQGQIDQDRLANLLNRLDQSPIYPSPAGHLFFLKEDIEDVLSLFQVREVKQ